MTLPLSKTLDPADFEQLTEELTIVDRYFTTAAEQHPMRRWEYAMALRAQETWLARRYPEERGGGGRIYDVGGGGSPFWRMVGDRSCVIDPEDTSRQTLSYYLKGSVELGHQVFCLSVLEHVDDLDQFLYHLSCLVAPGGLLFLTVDICGCSRHDTEHDPHHFHWMRRRIFSIDAWRYLWVQMKPYGFDLLGRTVESPTSYDGWQYHGNHVYDYSFCSLALVKRS